MASADAGLKDTVSTFGLPTTMSPREFYETHGFYGPVNVFSPSQAHSLRNRFFDFIGQREEEAGATDLPLYTLHERFRWVYDMGTHPALLDAAARLIGPDVLFWASNFWYKEPNSPNAVPWHTDGAFWEVEPKTVLTAWVALSPATAENGCMRFLPGSHKRSLSLVAARQKYKLGFFTCEIPAELIDESQAVDVELAPGQVIFFNESLIHSSRPSQSRVPRIGYSARFSPPNVKFLLEKWYARNDSVQTLLVRGEDHHHLNDSIRVQPPSDAM